MFHPGWSKHQLNLEIPESIKGHMSNEGSQGIKETDFSWLKEKKSNNKHEASILFFQGYSIVVAEGRVCSLRKNCCSRLVLSSANGKNWGEIHAQTICHLFSKRCSSWKWRNVVPEGYKVDDKQKTFWPFKGFLNDKPTLSPTYESWTKVNCWLELAWLLKYNSFFPGSQEKKFWTIYYRTWRIRPSGLGRKLTWKHIHYILEYVGRQLSSLKRSASILLDPEKWGQICSVVIGS